MAMCLTAVHGVAMTTVQSIRPYTTTDFTFDRWLTVDDQTSIVFRVRACNDAHLALGQIPGNFDVNTYQLVIGGNGNKQHFLRDGISGTTLKVRDLNSFLHALKI